MGDWRLQDMKIVCCNLQNKITPYRVKEHVIVNKMRKIRKELNCDEYTAWKILCSRLRSEIEDNRGREHGRKQD